MDDSQKFCPGKQFYSAQFGLKRPGRIGLNRGMRHDSISFNFFTAITFCIVLITIKQKGPKPMSVASLLRTTFLLRCPHCGAHTIFESPLRVYEVCPNCGQTNERDRGNFLGAMIVNHFLTALVLVIYGVWAFQTGHTTYLLGIMILIACGLTAILYPFTRAFWLWAMLHIQKP